MTLMKDYLFKLGFFAAILLFILFSMDRAYQGKFIGGNITFSVTFDMGMYNTEHVFAIF